MTLKSKLKIRDEIERKLLDFNREADLHKKRIDKIITDIDGLLFELEESYEEDSK